MNGITMSRRPLLLTAVLAGACLAAAACGSSGTQVKAPPASPHTAAEAAATRTWLAQTNKMWTSNNFAALDQVTTGEMRAIYQNEQKQSTRSSSRKALQLSGLSITVPCHAGLGNVFVAYASTNVFTLGQGMDPYAMVFQRTGGAWKLSAVVRPPGGSSSWPALCRQGAAPATAAVLAPSGYGPDLARVLTAAMTGAAVTAAGAAPFTVNGFLAGSGSVTGQAAQWLRQDRKAGVSLTGGFTPAADATFAFPLAGGRGYWLIGFLTQSNTHNSPSGFRKAAWPDGTSVTTPRLAVVHHQSDTFITTYAAIDPARSAGGTVALDGFFGWQLASTSS